ncbi:hypothetical protein LXL04_026372 [Taraxacum kok-saghyz]
MMKIKSMGDDASFTHVPANHNNKIVVNEERNNKMFSCSSCPRKFASQHAMAGHRNIHRSEWELLLQERHPIVDPTNTLKSPSSLANPTTILKRSSGPSNILKESSRGATHYTFLRVTKTLRKPLVVDHTHLLNNRVQYFHGKSALGDYLWSRAGSTFGWKKMMEGNLRCFGTNYNNNIYVKSLSTTKGATSSCSPQSGSSRETFDFFTSSFRFTRGLVTQPDNNGENEPSLDIDLDLKL